MSSRSMPVILVDSSAWIEYQRATGSPADLRLARAIETDEPLTTTGLVLLDTGTCAGRARE